MLTLPVEFERSIAPHTGHIMFVLQAKNVLTDAELVRLKDCHNNDYLMVRLLHEILKGNMDNNARDNLVNEVAATMKSSCILFPLKPREDIQTHSVTSPSVPNSNTTTSRSSFSSPTYQPKRTSWTQRSEPVQSHWDTITLPYSRSEPEKTVEAKMPQKNHRKEFLDKFFAKSEEGSIPMEFVERVTKKSEDGTYKIESILHYLEEKRSLFDDVIQQWGHTPSTHAYGLWGYVKCINNFQFFEALGEAFAEYSV